jgi:hypothetical protein
MQEVTNYVFDVEAEDADAAFVLSYNVPYHGNTIEEYLVFRDVLEVEEDPAI